MKVKRIFLTPENVLDYQEENVHSFYGQKCLDLHMELNDALGDATSKSIDAGGQYASWLNNIGINHQTDYGWWNKTATNHDNMQLFVDYWNGDQGDLLVDTYQQLANKINGLPAKLKIQMIDDYVIVSDYLNI